MDEIKPLTEETARRLIRVLHRLRYSRERWKMFQRGQISYREWLCRTYGYDWLKKERQFKRSLPKTTYKTLRHDCAKRNGRR